MTLTESWETSLGVMSEEARRDTTRLFGDIRRDCCAPCLSRAPFAGRVHDRCLPLAPEEEEGEARGSRCQGRRDDRRNG